MRERIVIAGAGTTGFQVARHLLADHKDVVLIEKNTISAKYALSHLDCIVITGAANHLPTLREAGTEDAEFFISVTDNDELNIVTCGLVANEFKVPCKIARVRNPDYLTIHPSDRPFIDVDYFVSPEVEAAQAIISSVRAGANSAAMIFDNTDIQMRNFLIDDNTIVTSRNIFAPEKSQDLNFIVAGISRGDEFFVPTPDRRIESDDELYLVGTENTLDNLFSLAGRPRIRLRNILLVGGGRVGSFVAQALVEKSDKARRNGLSNNHKSNRPHLKIVDSNYEHCKLLAERFPNAVIINSDISEEGFFEEEDLSINDLIITTTNNPELNILVAIYAKTLGIKRSISLVNKFNYLTVATHFGADVIISPQYSVVNAILKFVRRGKVKSVSSIFSGHAEVIESTLDGSRGFVGKKIGELTMPANSKIIAITRNNSHFIANTDFELNEKDLLIMVSKTESMPQVEKMFNF